ncbi:MAG: hypothetical protein ACI4WH_03525 [Oscillospiraceae bacterium]
MEIKYHLPDFVRHFKLNILMYETMKMRPYWFYDNVKIGSIYGAFPTALWNGGRSISGHMDRKYMQLILHEFNRRGIPCRYTFSNPMIKEEHLQDEFCNWCLKVAENGLNEVIVMSPILEKYIRENYPKYKIVSSTCKQIEDLSHLKDELNKNYSLVVLDYNYNNQFDVLEKIPNKDKCEILINPCCVPNCKRRKQHYEYIGDFQIKLANHMKENPNAPLENEDFKCPYMEKQFYQTTKFITHVRPDDLYKKYVPMGYSNFKIEGRPLPDLAVLESYIYYMVKPEYQNEARLFISLWLTENVRHFN